MRSTVPPASSPAVTGGAHKRPHAEAAAAAAAATAPTASPSPLPSPSLLAPAPTALQTASAQRVGTTPGPAAPSHPLGGGSRGVRAAAQHSVSSGPHDCLLMHHHEESLESAWRVYTGLIERHVRCIYNRDMLKQASDRRYPSFLQTLRNASALVVLVTPRYLKALEAPDNVCAKELTEAARIGRQMCLVLLDGVEASGPDALVQAAPHLAAVITGPHCMVVDGKAAFASAIDAVVATIQSKSNTAA